VTEPTIAADGAFIVIRGHFNPAIFSPGWLLAVGLIGETEAKDARPEAILPHLSIFEVAWLRCEVTDDRLSVTTQDAREFDRLRDTAAGILQTLSHTPVGALGFNRICHIAVPDLHAWHTLGDAIAPKEVWGDVLDLPGMLNVTVQGVRPDTWAGHVQVSVQPSRLVAPGIYISYNDHYLLKKVAKQPSARDEFAEPFATEASEPVAPSADLIPAALGILHSNWSDAMVRAEAVTTKVWGLRSSSRRAT
jgi:hypothetical protein